MAHTLRLGCSLCQSSWASVPLSVESPRVTPTWPWILCSWLHLTCGLVNINKPPLRKSLVSSYVHHQVCLPIISKISETKVGGELGVLTYGPVPWWYVGRQRMGTRPQNSLVRYCYGKRSQVLAKAEKDVSMLPEDVTLLNQNLRAMQMTLEKYDGSPLFSDWHKEFNKTKREQDIKKLHLLVFNLRSQAKATYRATADDDRRDLAKVCQALRDIFEERQSQRHQRKLALYKRHQESHESLRVLGLSQQDPQAHIALKGHHFKTVNDLLKLGLISENFGEPAQESTLKILMEEVRPLRLERQQQATMMPPTVKAVTFAEPGTQYNCYQGNGFQGSYQRQSRLLRGNYRAPYYNANMSVSGWKTDKERKTSRQATLLYSSTIPQGCYSKNSGPIIWWENWECWPLGSAHDARYPSNSAVIMGGERSERNA